MLGRLSFVVCLLLASTQGLPLETNLLDPEQVQVIPDAKYEFPVEPQEQVEYVPEDEQRQSRYLEALEEVDQETLKVLEDEVPAIERILNSIKSSNIEEEPQARFGFQKFDKFSLGSILSPETIIQRINTNLQNRLQALRDRIQTLIETLEALKPTTTEAATTEAATTEAATTEAATTEAATTEAATTEAATTEAATTEAATTEAATTVVSVG